MTTPTTTTTTASDAPDAPTDAAVGTRPPGHTWVGEAPDGPVTCADCGATFAPATGVLTAGDGGCDAAAITPDGPGGGAPGAEEAPPTALAKKLGDLLTSTPDFAPPPEWASMKALSDDLAKQALKLMALGGPPGPLLYKPDGASPVFKPHGNAPIVFSAQDLAASEIAVVAKQVPKASPLKIKKPFHPHDLPGGDKLIFTDWSAALAEAAAAELAAGAVTAGLPNELAAVFGVTPAPEGSDEGDDDEAAAEEEEEEGEGDGASDDDAGDASGASGPPAAELYLEAPLPIPWHKGVPPSWLKPKPELKIIATGPQTHEAAVYVHGAGKIPGPCELHEAGGAHPALLINVHGPQPHWGYKFHAGSLTFEVVVPAASAEAAAERLAAVLKDLVVVAGATNVVTCGGIHGGAGMFVPKITLSVAPDALPLDIIAPTPVWTPPWNYEEDDGPPEGGLNHDEPTVDADTEEDVWGAAEATDEASDEESDEESDEGSDEESDEGSDEGSDDPVVLDGNDGEYTNYN